MLATGRFGNGQPLAVGNFNSQSEPTGGRDPQHKLVGFPVISGAELTQRSLEPIHNKLVTHVW